MSTLADRLRRALAEATPPRTQAELARACGLKGPSVSNWATGATQTLKAESAILAADFLGVRPRWLIDGIGPMRHAAPSSAPPSPAAPTLADALERLGIELVRDMPDEVREDVADALHKLAMRRGAERDQRVVEQLLTAPPGKRQNAP